MKKPHTQRTGGMNRQKFLKDLEKFISDHNENPDLTLEKAAEILLKEVERLGMIPVSKYQGFMSSCVIHDWEENITEENVISEFHRQTDRE